MVPSDRERFCTGCGRPAEVCQGCTRPLDPPRFCPFCGRRLVVTLTPAGFHARCGAHGALAASCGGAGHGIDGEAGTATDGQRTSAGAGTRGFEPAVRSD